MTALEKYLVPDHALRAHAAIVIRKLDPEEAKRLDLPGLIIIGTEIPGMRVGSASIHFYIVRFPRQRFRTARQFERTTPLEAVPVDRELAEAAAALKLKHGLGLADAFAAALAIDKKAQLAAADKEFDAVEKEIRIIWLK